MSHRQRTWNPAHRRLFITALFLEEGDQSWREDGGDLLSLRRWGGHPIVKWREQRQEYGKNIVLPGIPTNCEDSHFDFLWGLGAMFSMGLPGLPQKKADILMIFPAMSPFIWSERSVLDPADELFFKKRCLFFFLSMALLVKSSWAHHLIFSF